jgi:hypothetical protein
VTTYFLVPTLCVEMHIPLSALIHCRVSGTRSSQLQYLLNLVERHGASFFGGAVGGDAGGYGLGGVF